MVKHDVQLEEYVPHEHGGYVLRMLGELYDTQAKLFKQGSGIRLMNPIANISDHIVDIITFNGERCGIILSAPSCCFEESCSICDVILEEGYRRKGIARKALTMVISKAIADGAKRMTLNVHCDNLPALRLYESMGFKAQSQWMVLNPAEPPKPEREPVGMAKDNAIIAQCDNEVLDVLDKVITEGTMVCNGCGCLPADCSCLTELDAESAALLANILRPPVESKEED